MGGGYNLNKLVSIVKLGEIATDIYRGSGITREQVVQSGTPCVRYGEIYTTYHVWFDRCVSYADPAVVRQELRSVLSVRPRIRDRHDVPAFVHPLRWSALQHLTV